MNTNLNQHAKIVINNFKTLLNWKIILIYYIVILILGLSSEFTLIMFLRGTLYFIVFILVIFGYAILESKYYLQTNSKDNIVTTEQEEYFTVPDVRNKLSPFSNLIALVKLELNNSDSVIYRSLIESEIKQCEENIKYLSKKD